MDVGSESSRRGWRARIVLVAGGVALALGLAELAVRGWNALRPVAGPALHRPRLDETFLYALDPAHPEVSAQGLRRDGVVDVPCPEGVERILVLGDSVTFGAGVSAADAIPQQLERLLRGRRAAEAGTVEVLNAGVHGWSTFNERAFYETEGRRFGAETVVLIFCLNDVANPHLHWRFAAELAGHVPDAAVPDPKDHAERGVAVLDAQYEAWRRKRSFPWSLLRRSALVRAVWQAVEERVDYPEVERDGRTWPGHITGDDTQSIESIEDADAPAWGWVRGQLGALRDAVRADGARFCVAVVPLAYQLEPGYPVFPQERLAAICAELGVDYEDLRPALAELGVERAFLGRASGYDDVWHLTAAGCAVCAERLAARFW